MAVEKQLDPVPALRLVAASVRVALTEGQQIQRVESNNKNCDKKYMAEPGKRVAANSALAWMSAGGVRRHPRESR